MVAIHLGSKRRPLSLKCCCNNCWVPHLSHSPLSFFSLPHERAPHLLAPAVAFSLHPDSRLTSAPICIPEEGSSASGTAASLMRRAKAATSDLPPRTGGSAAKAPAQQHNGGGGATQAPREGGAAAAAAQIPRCPMRRRRRAGLC